MLLFLLFINLIDKRFFGIFIDKKISWSFESNVFNSSKYSDAIFFMFICSGIASSFLYFWENSFIFGNDLFNIMESFMGLEEFIYCRYDIFESFFFV